MKLTGPFVVGIAYIAFMIGGTLSDIGDSYSGGVYPWYLPLIVLCITGFPFIAGIIAGLEGKENKK